MSGLPKHELLARDIAAVLESNHIQRSGTRALLLTGIALACLQPGQADALTLGDLKVKSTIGQPLISTTTARITNGESLSTGCVTSVGNPQGSFNLPEDLTVTVPETSAPGTHPIQITSTRPLYEPMYEIRLQVKCPGNVSLIRSYVVMLNMPMTSPQTQPVNDNPKPALQVNSLTQAQPKNTAPLIPQQDQPAASAAPSATASAPAAAEAATGASQRPYTERFPTPMEPITTAAEYRVQAGDTLSTIAQRIQGRPANSTYEVAAVLHQLNPDAFVNNDPNRVKLGSVLSIPPVEELLGREMVAMRPNPAVITDKQISAPVVEQTVDTPVETSIEAPAIEITPEQVPAESTPVTATPEESITNAAENAGDIKVEAEIPSPAPAQVPALISTDAELTETQILVDKSLLENLPDQDEIEPVAESEVRKLAEYEPDIAVTQADTTVVQEDASTVHPLLIAGLGALLALIVAFLVFGKRMLGSIFPGRTEQQKANALDDLGLPDELSADLEQEQEQEQEQPDFGTDTDVIDDTPDTDIADEQPEQTVLPVTADIGAGTGTDVDLDISASAEDQEDSLDFDLGSLEAEGAQENVQQVNLQEIEHALDEEAPLEKTERFSGPDFSTDGSELDQPPSELDGTATMRKLFSEEADARKAEAVQNDDDFNVTQEMPELNEGTSLDATSDLQSLADNVSLDNPDDQLSATLTQALGLLEQDYEDEYSESQILEQREVETAFAEFEKKD